MVARLFEDLEMMMVCVSVQKKDEETLRSLMLKSEEELLLWAMDDDVEISLDFLRWISDRESSSIDELEKEKLCNLGGTLTAVHVGLVPVGKDQLEGVNAEFTMRGETRVRDGGDGGDGGGGGSGSGSNSSSNNSRNSGASSGTSSSARDGVSIQREMPMKLSAESMVLLQQQAAALEATVGIRRAESLVQLLGRRQISTDAQMTMVKKEDSKRILEVLVQIRDRQQRCLMMLEAFVPVTEDDDGGGGGDDVEEFDEGEEALSTTPFVLLQTIDGILHSETKSEELLEDVSAQMGLPMPREHLDRILSELREDVMSSLFDSNSSGDSF